MISVRRRLVLQGNMSCWVLALRQLLALCQRRSWLPSAGSLAAAPFLACLCKKVGPCWKTERSCKGQLANCPGPGGGEDGVGSWRSQWLREDSRGAFGPARAIASQSICQMRGNPGHAAPPPVLFHLSSPPSSPSSPHPQRLSGLPTRQNIAHYIPYKKSTSAFPARPPLPTNSTRGGSNLRGACTAPLVHCQTAARCLWEACCAPLPRRARSPHGCVPPAHPATAPATSLRVQRSMLCLCQMSQAGRNM